MSFELVSETNKVAMVSGGTEGSTFKHIFIQFNLESTNIDFFPACVYGRRRWEIFGQIYFSFLNTSTYESFADVGEIRVYQRADFQSGSRVLKKVF